MRWILARLWRGTALFLLAVIAVSGLLIGRVAADTDGTEIQIADEPERLILQLGTEWAGAQFELRTDAGVFPMPVVVDRSGVLTMDLGGSKTYTLRYLESGLSPQGFAAAIGEGAETSNSNGTDGVPTGTNGAGTATNQSAGAATHDVVITNDNAEAATGIAETTEAATSAQEPSIVPFPLFFGGIAAIGIGYVAFRIIKRRRERYAYDDDEDYDDEGDR